MNRRAAILATVVAGVLAAAATFVAWTTLQWPPAIVAVAFAGVAMVLSTQLRTSKESP
ncbi:MAG TPA: hypothetical protein VJ874_05125 [Candidatus Thermoplasmatota archaeon]|nr:hypothetical protein [Candidatus Thermoplasmatota archaeon]